MIKTFFMVAALGLAAIASTVADPVRPVAGHHPHMMICEYGAKNRLVELGADGKVLWEHKVPSLTVMFEVQKNGNVMYAYGGNPTGVQEVDRDNKIVWDFKAPCEQVLSFEKLSNGNVLVGMQGPCKAVEVNRKGEIIRETTLTTDEKPAHRQLRHVRKLKNGNLLACHEGDGTVREYDKDGKVIWDYPGVPSVFDAQRLPNGNTLISAGTGARVIEVTPDKKIVWEFGKDDAPDMGIAWITSAQRKKNGNLVLANFIPGKTSGVLCFEMTRDKKVIWQFDDRTVAGTVTCCMTLED